MSDSTVKRVAAWGSVIAVVLSVVSIVFAAGGRNTDVTRMSEALADHEQRIRSVEGTQADIRADVRVIKQQLSDLHRFFLPRQSAATEINLDPGRSVQR